MTRFSSYSLIGYFQLLYISVSTSCNLISHREYCRLGRMHVRKSIYSLRIHQLPRQRSAGSSLPKEEARFNFVEDHGHTLPSDSHLLTTFAVRSQYLSPTLEDVEEDLEGVSCSASEIELPFSSTERLKFF